MDFRLEVTEREGWSVVTASGEIDVATAPRLREQLIDLINSKHHRLVVDLSWVDFIDSTGLGVLIGALLVRRSRLTDSLAGGPHLGPTLRPPHRTGDGGEHGVGAVHGLVVAGAVDIINGFGKSVGLMQVDELGTIETPILLTNTFGVGTCANALIRHAIAASPEIARTTSTVNPLVCECNDGKLSDIQAMAVTEEDAMAAIRNACDMTVVQGSVGAGTGMKCFGFKGGIGTASRLAQTPGNVYTVGALVQANHGDRGDLRLDGLPLGRVVDAAHTPTPWEQPQSGGSLLVIIATDAPLLPQQCRRLAQRAAVGFARVGGVGHNGSGDLFLAFATGNHITTPWESPAEVLMLPNHHMNPLFSAVAEAVEEAILNVLVAAETMTGYKGRTAHALPLDAVQALWSRRPL